MSNKMNSLSNKHSGKKAVNERAKQYKLYAVGSVVILGVIVLLVNILFDNLLGKALTFDFTLDKSSSISAESQKFIDSLPEGTRFRIVGLFERPESVVNTKYQYIAPLLDDYAKKSKGKITVEYQDLQAHPGIISELDPAGAYGLSNLKGQYAVYYNGKLDIIDPINCYTIDTNYLEQYNAYLATGNNVEYTFTNSMITLMKGYTSKAYVLTGLKEDSCEQLKRMLASLGVETAELAVVSDFKIPDDCSLIILNGPDTDITETAYLELKNYIARGGNVIVSVEYSSENVNEPFTNLNRLLNEMNINIEHCMISENDPNYQLNGHINNSLADIGPVFAGLISEKRLNITLSRPITYSVNQRADVITSPVLLSSASATKSVAGENNEAKQIDSNPAVLNAAMHSCYANGDKGQLFVFGTVNFTSDAYFSEYTITDKNADFIRACVRNMLPASDAYNVNIPVKKIENYKLNDNDATASAATAIMVVFMIVLPIALSSMAVIVYNKRKNL
jgi:hypothetical protein